MFGGPFEIGPTTTLVEETTHKQEEIGETSCQGSRFGAGTLGDNYVQE